MNLHKHSVTPDAESLVLLRHRLGWTQKFAAGKAGYSVRVIRKIEKQQPVRPQTLRDVMQCYSVAIEERLQGLWDSALSQSANTSRTKEEEGFECELVGKIREYYDVVYRKRQLARISDYASPCIRLTSEGESRIGIEAVQRRVATLLNAFDPIEISIERIFSKDQVVVTSWVARMRHVGDFFEIAATEKWIRVRGSCLAVFAGGLVVEVEDHFDIDSLVRQLTGIQQRVI